MNGIVDERNRALITISVGPRDNGQFEDVVALVDTAFDGHLVFSRSLIRRLGLESLVETEAILADGSKVALETFIRFVDWFGQQIPVQVIANEKSSVIGHGTLGQSPTIHKLRDQTGAPRLTRRTPG